MEKQPAQQDFRSNEMKLGQKCTSKIQEDCLFYTVTE